MTPAGRIEASIALLSAIDDSAARPADALANDFFRPRRYIGSGDRRAVSDRVWIVLRRRRRLIWRLARTDTAPTPRLLVAASLLLEGSTLADAAQAFSGGRFAPAPLERESTRHYATWKVTRWSTRPCQRRCDWKSPTGCCRSSPTASVQSLPRNSQR